METDGEDDHETNKVMEKTSGIKRRATTTTTTTYLTPSGGGSWP